ncbi:MAG: serine hydrolase domain-containing protein [Maricaulaceae bacterium]
MKRLLLSSAFFLAACGGDDAPIIEAPTFDKAAMDTLLSGAVENGEVLGVSALIFDEGQTVYTGTFGMADRERGVPVAMDTVFRIYSMTKPITAAVIMDLVEEGKLSLSDPASKYIPELADMSIAKLNPDGHFGFLPQAKPMTIEDLLLHRAGMGYGIFGPVNPVEALYEKAGLFNPTEDLSVKMTKLGKLPLLAQPGDGWYYSYSIDVLGRIAEVVTGQRLSEIMDERIFDPLGMNETAFSVRPDQKARFSSNYAMMEDGSFVVQDNSQESQYLTDNAYQSGGGGLVSTLGDYAKFAQMLLDGGIYDGKRVLDEATVAMMMSDRMDADDAFMMPWLGGETGVSFGYGGSIVTDTTPELQAKNGRSVGQFGWGGMAKTKFWVDKPNDAFGILMLQYFAAADPALHDSFQALALEGTLDAE